jgi:hypothetical protein
LLIKIKLSETLFSWYTLSGKSKLFRAFSSFLIKPLADKGFVIQRDSGKPMLFGLDKIHAIFITEVMEKAFE